MVAIDRNEWSQSSECALPVSSCRASLYNGAASCSGDCVADPRLPYFDFVFAKLADKNAAVEKSFGRHVHWGYWPDPASATGDDDDFAAAAERLSLEVCGAAGIVEGERVLDAGCGFGGTIALLNERFDHLRLNGLNIDERQLEHARHHVVARTGNVVEFTAGDACALPFPDASFDRVLAVECIFHFPSRELFLSEASRVLRPGGILALTDFVPAAPFVWLARYATEAPALAQYQFFGRVNLDSSRGYYRRIARRAGLLPWQRRNLTFNTLPTYRYLLDLLKRTSPVEGIIQPIPHIAHGVMWASRLGMMRYELFSFRKPEGGDPNSG